MKYNQSYVNVKYTRKLVKDAFKFVKSKCIAEHGCCIEASVNMHAYLRKRGVEVQLKRYETEDGGHWTIDTPVGEFDPTISCWEKKNDKTNPGSLHAPEDSTPGKLYKINENSPHWKEWEEECEVDEQVAYDTVWLEEEL